MPLQLQADREMFGNVSAPRPSLNEAPVAEGTIRCFVCVSFAPQQMQLDVFIFGCL